MREITSHKVGDCKLDVLVVDEPSAAGASHIYELLWPHLKPDPGRTGMQIRFQSGAINDVGNNGITQEALIAICIDRLQCFQTGPFACRENAIALTKLQEAMMWLQQRTRDRMARGVEGKSER